MSWAAFRAEATQAVAAALGKLGVQQELPLEQPPDPSMGDIGVPCFALARSLRRSPVEIARDLARAIEAQPRGAATWIHCAEAVGPYCNLTIRGDRLAAAILADAGHIACPPTGKNVLVEHTSANPNGPLHIGRARNPILGDTIVRLLRAAGDSVEAQYYMDNLGRQVALLAWGVWNVPPETLPDPARNKADHVLVRFYQAAHERMKSSPSVAAEVDEMVRALEEADPATLARVRPVYGECFAGMRQSLERLHISFDLVKDESDLVEDGSVPATMEALAALPQAGLDGAQYLDLSSVLKGQKDRFFFARSDGSSVYATRDIAYHAWKAKRVGAGRSVDILGEDHRLQALQVGTALEWLGHPRPHVVFYSFVSLAGEKGKMSTRAGRVVYLDDLVDEAVGRARAEVLSRRAEDLEVGLLSEEEVDAIAEAVGVGAVRFGIAKIQAEKPIDFRWEEALDFDGDSAPYLMYAHARACSVMAKTEAQPTAAKPGPGEIALLKRVAEMPDAVREAASDFAPHRFCAYALALAASFNDYYRDHRVVGHPDRAVAELRRQTMDAARMALRTAIETLGLEPLEAM